MYGTAGDDELRDVAVTSDGTILIAGFEDSRGGIGSRGVVLESRYGLRKRATLDTLGSDAFEAIAIDPTTKHVWVAGRTNGSIPELFAHGGFDSLLGSLGPSGFEPVYRGAYSSQEFPKQLAVGSGYIALAGHEERLVADGSTWIDPFLSAFRTDGAQHWHTIRQSADVERYTAVDVSGTTVIAGGQTAAGATPGMFVAIYTEESNSATRHRISTSGSDELAAIRVLPDGDILWAGTTSGQLGDVAHGGKDIVVGRLDAETGESLWIAQLGTDGDDHVDDIALDDAGNIFVAADATTGDSTDRDVVFLSLDSEGTVKSYEQWGSTGDDVPTAIALDACGTAVLVGHTTGDLAGTSHGGRDGFVITARGFLANPR
ncbi:MAG: hypothetical protein HOV81_00210 [Kofleriaceae bacterium]|nr:hypothetical protein [Kofleriaceae bacterium]